MRYVCCIGKQTKKTDSKHPTFEVLKYYLRMPSDLFMQGERKSQRWDYLYGVKHWWQQSVDMCVQLVPTYDALTQSSKK